MPAWSEAAVLTAPVAASSSESIGIREFRFCVELRDEGSRCRFAATVRR